MKKMLLMIFSGVLIAILVFCVGCDTRTREYKKILAKDETDGQFYYYYDDNIEGYAIVGDMEENNPEVMYLPAYYKGKEVKQVFYTAVVSSFGMRQKSFGPSFNNVKKLYVPYTPLTHRYWDNGEGKPYYVQQIYYSGVSLTSLNTDFAYFLFEINHFAHNQNYFLKDTFYLKLITMLKTSYSDSDLYIWEEYKDKTVIIFQDKMRIDSEIAVLNSVYITFQKANIVFYFNYNGSSNNDVFFVDNSKYGEKIKNIPYNPIREGYEFIGWFKESECLNKWDFEKDTLPIVEYDENGNTTEFIETKLYAGWRKK